ncbi:MAG: preprotein translocase subunit SecE [Chloroflexi bacterium]|nr:preprotein translocase subunit SecE [Chloroflexota bacterium]
MTYRTTTAKQSGPRFGFFSETIAELKKVVWLSRQEAIYLTALVLIVSIAVGLILGIIDYGFTRLVNDVFIGR